MRIVRWRFLFSCFFYSTVENAVSVDLDPVPIVTGAGFIIIFFIRTGEMVVFFFFFYNNKIIFMGARDDRENEKRPVFVAVTVIDRLPASLPGRSLS